MDFLLFYSQFPEAVLEYYDLDYDLAVISFYSENEHTVLSIASNPPEHNTPVAAMGNPHDYRNAVTAGQITSKVPVPFEAPVRTLHNVVEHTAKVQDGSSGGALLNKNLEIVGINIGGAITDCSEFVWGLAMPSDKVLEFLDMAANKRAY
jgi:S1-C subfamily serine protease